MKPTDKMTDTQELAPDELVRAQDADTDNARAYKCLGFNLMKRLDQQEATIAARDAEIERHKAVADAAHDFIQTHWRAVGVGSAKMADRVAAAAAFQRLDSALTQWKETPSPRKGDDNGNG